MELHKTQANSDVHVYNDQALTQEITQWPVVTTHGALYNNPRFFYVTSDTNSTSVRDIAFEARSFWLDTGGYATDRVRLTAIKVNIKKDTTVITDTTTNVIVGEKISLEGIIEPSGMTVESKQWTIENPGEVIKKWEVEWNETGGKKGTGGLEAHIQALTSLDQSSLLFYWVNGSFSGNSREVKYKVIVYGTEIEGKTLFIVYRPTAEFSISSDQVYLDHPNYEKPGHWLHYGLGGYGPPYGVEATNTISVPAGFTSYSDIGYYDGAIWVQLGNVNREMKEDGTWTEWKSGGYYLDRDYPYAEGTTVVFNDSPAQQIENPGVSDYSEVKVITEAYKTWLLWRPAGTDTIPVPLKRIEWNWSGHVLKTGGVWGLLSSGNSTPSLSETTIHPEWTFTIPSDVEEVPMQ